VRGDRGERGERCERANVMKEAEEGTGQGWYGNSDEHGELVAEWSWVKCPPKAKRLSAKPDTDSASCYIAFHFPTLTLTLVTTITRS